MLKDKIVREILDSSLKKEKNFLYGNYRGFNIVINEGNNAQLFVKIGAHSDSEKKEELSDYLQSKKKELKNIVDIGLEKEYIYIKMNSTALKKNLPPIINEVIDTIIDYLQAKRYVSGCELCGNSANANFYEVKDDYHCLCDNCMNSIDNELGKVKQEKSEQVSNVFLGICGSVIGTIVGGIVWIIIFNLGYIASIGGLAIGVCSLKGYQILGKALDKKGIVVSVIIILISVFIINKVCWAMSAYSELSEYYTFSQCYTGLDQLMEAADLTAMYIRDLIVGYSMTIIGCFSLIQNAFKESSGNYKITKKD